MNDRHEFRRYVVFLAILDRTLVDILFAIAGGNWRTLCLLGYPRIDLCFSPTNRVLSHAGLVQLLLVVSIIQRSRGLKRL